MCQNLCFQMTNSKRQTLIKRHSFYVKQARKLVLSQFNDIEAAADREAEEWLENSSLNFDPGQHDPVDFVENSGLVKIEYYGMLSEMREQVYLRLR